MDLGCALHQYQEVDISRLLEEMSNLGTEYWECDHQTRTSLAGDRPGNAVFLYNDSPYFAQRKPLLEAKTGTLNVLRYPQRPLYNEVTKIIEEEISPNFPECQVMRVQLAELPPGQTITPHRDMGILSLIHRTHIPLITNPGVKFIIQREEFYLEPGILYDLNNVVVHSVENTSEHMRIHLLVDMLPNSLARCVYHDDADAFQMAIGEVVH